MTNGKVLSVRRLSEPGPAQDGATTHPHSPFSWGLLSLGQDPDPALTKRSSSQPHPHSLKWSSLCFLLPAQEFFSDTWLLPWIF
jgi:hypothetical protein